MKNVSGKSCRGNRNTLFMFYIYIYIYFFFFLKNHVVYEIMWKNIVERGRPQMTIWCMRIACWIPKATSTHSQYVTHYFSIAAVVARTPLNVKLHVQCLSCAKTEFSVHGRSCHLYLRKMILCVCEA